MTQSYLFGIEQVSLPILSILMIAERCVFSKQSGPPIHETLLN